MCYFFRFEENNIYSLKDLAYISEKQLLRITQGRTHDHGDWQNYVRGLRDLIEDRIGWQEMETTQYLRYRKGFTLNPSSKRGEHVFILPKYCILSMCFTYQYTHVEITWTLTCFAETKNGPVEFESYWKANLTFSMLAYRISPDKHAGCGGRNQSLNLVWLQGN